ncbi:nicotinate-nucleotide adenylyltransferase [Legionella sp. 27cVA30]|uniref:Probable nicotinate-nucleotide adenylyltransferase n=1 Tax=Legionella septentrionalis TaxID=2498109 RepID=A0A433JIQ7_9GAMM|nr:MULTISPECIES: nicotinate-nucleotide adenylyltransferase [Legionella]MCP0913302.1 nicotinate-nucleotide adenylyltransferase [Legionella sp. 27cVA30]RUQ85198.1 nicotinate-nucleotide adenylyltransferase [Legionella septentrionalis]RUR14660.1 nicotinate-nucleotide adenylyltransferase [Legionella septentrionalis]
MHNIIIYGGSFDPIHNGHLKTALQVQNEFNFESFIFLPCKIPLLKEATKASAKQRMQMLQQAVFPYPAFKIDLREIEREGPSYMVETLKSFRKECGECTAINLLVGMDTFLQLPQWYQWQKIIGLANILVMERPTDTIENSPDALKKVLQKHQTLNKKDLLNCAAGKIYLYNAGFYPVSSSWLREQIKKGNDVSSYLPGGIAEYIKAQGLYQ